jgi:hypothetical protein
MKKATVSMTLKECLAMDREIATGKIPFEEAIERLVARGMIRSRAGRHAAILTGRIPPTPADPLGNGRPKLFPSNRQR